MKYLRVVTILLALALFAVACQSAPDPAVVAATISAQTAAAASPTPQPSQTPIPPTATAVPPTATEVPPTATVEPTQTPLPTEPPTITPTPGPLLITDDFSAKSDIWGKCDKCEWKDGKLFFGPYEPKGDGIDQTFSLICEACGEHEYYRIAADITFAAGQAGDRTYGVGGVIPDKFYVGTGITPWQYAAIEAADFAANKWFGSSFKRYTAVKASSLTNHVEFVIKPDSTGNVTYYAIVNGKTIIFLAGQRGLAFKPAIYLGWHSVGISVDNFEFEEILP